MEGVATLWTWWEPQGWFPSLREFSHASISHIFFCLLWVCLLNTPSPVKMTDSNNSLEIYSQSATVTCAGVRKSSRCYYYFFPEI